MSVTIFISFKIFSDFVMQLLEGPSLTFSGQINVDENKNFGFFAMDTSDVRSKLANVLHMLNLNRKKKSLSGTILMCRFTTHSGIRIIFICSCDTVLIYLLGPHITLWMNSERIRKFSHKSIKVWLGQLGEVEVKKWHFVKAGKTILLTAEGK